MDLANPTLVYIIVCLDRSIIAAGIRLDRSKRCLETLQNKVRTEEQDKEFETIKKDVDELLKDVLMTSSKAAVQVNDAVSNMPQSLESMQFNEAVTIGFEQVKYATAKIIEADMGLLSMTKIVDSLAYVVKEPEKEA